MGALDINTRLTVRDGVMTVERSQDCTAIMENAKLRQAVGDTGSSDMRLAASLPYVIIEKYCNDNGVEFAECMSNKQHLKRICNDPDNSLFRVWTGRV